MEQGKIYVFTGEGHGKSPAALGCALQEACQGKSVVIIQFLKGKGLEKSEFVKRLEPEIKIFRFEKEVEDFLNLSAEKRGDAIMSIRNGMNYARKVMMVDECDLLILDEVLGLIDNRIISEEELKGLMACKPEDMTLIMTGATLRDDICVMADEVSKIQTLHLSSG